MRGQKALLGVVSPPHMVHETKQLQLIRMLQKTITRISIMFPPSHLVHSRSRLPTHPRICESVEHCCHLVDAYCGAGCFALTLLRTSSRSLASNSLSTRSTSPHTTWSPTDSRTRSHSVVAMPSRSSAFRARCRPSPQRLRRGVRAAATCVPRADGRVSVSQRTHADQVHLADRVIIDRR